MGRLATRYHPALVVLHWLLALLLIADLTIGTFVLTHIPNDSAQKIEGLRAHMSGGLLILFLLTLRLIVRAKTVRPPAAPTGSYLLDGVAWASHRLLYVAAFGMALSGAGMALEAHLPQIVFLGEGKLPHDFWVYPLRTVHFVFAKILIGLIALHILGALYHMIWRRDGLFSRMWFGRRFAMSPTQET